MPVGDYRPLPSVRPAHQLQTDLARHGDWFYRFRFDNGVETQAPDRLTEAVHDTRMRLIFPWLEHLVGDRWERTDAIDLACHQGWFATQIAVRGARSVRGYDVRAEHLDRAGLIRDAAGLESLEYAQADLFDLDAEPADVVLLLGLLYHVGNPLGALAAARRLTRRVCVVETQVARAAPDLSCLWGSGAPRSGPGIAVVPSDDVHAGGDHQVVLVPTLDALHAMLFAVGFTSVSLAVGGPGDSSQFADGDRVVVFALP